MRSIIVILGPTASGKSRLGVQLAKKFHGVVVSADSRQVYRGMDIGTGKITKKEMKGVPHFLLNVASPRSQYSVAQYVREATKIIQKTLPSRPIFLVGGSPFYIDALTIPNAFSPVAPNPVLRRRLEKLTTARLIARLQKIDPERLKTIDHFNRRRIIRAIEIPSVKTTGFLPLLPPMHVLKIGLSVPRPKLFQRIDRQTAQRLRRGMIRETTALHRHGVAWKRIKALGLEYRVLVQHIEGLLSHAEAEAKMKKVTHDFVRRQMTWWKRDQGIYWVTSPTEAKQLVKKFLQA